ncbi:MAG: CDP-diacylglycerol--glycerol-3-phosphate 3-phosphatidyltransferase [candidate division KSB1 bacterium]|nr:CDP-diacylglycerol--glycerol-3-phosphate 3-phosphatidyltransferase [candidate division KSB1 bacterium]MDZ7302816.1 CDP-diacylglycerol--glycerol-3-phosphate 3-phosphatidyltransferase [candidate division KSB1 bacterium]MDZ7311833.1 CDP-diacylglycerol--glycerol-3-phosphate 3-phosphatidyltransferase [candidate division KSB1 bacterium]
MTFPNQLTVLRIALTPLLVYLLSRESLSYRYASFVVFLLASLTDWYDGYAARKFGRVTESGKFLDPLADKVLVLTMFFIFMSLGLVRGWMVAVITVRDVVITGLRSYAEWKRQPIVTSMSAKWKTVSQMTAIYVILIYIIAQAHFAAAGVLPAWLTWLQERGAIDKMMLVVTFLTLATGIQYLFENWRHVRGVVLAFYRVFVPSNLAK